MTSQTDKRKIQNNNKNVFVVFTKFLSNLKKAGKQHFSFSY
jgi:hypothetical protein